MKTRLVLALAGGLTLAAALTPVTAGASITPNVGSHIRNTTAGGCAKDEGSGTIYAIATCATASNFTVIATKSYGGQTYREFEDGSGYCPTAVDVPADGQIAAGGCAGANTQFFYGPAQSGLLMTCLYDVLQDTHDWLTKSGVSNGYYTWNDNGTAGASGWAYPG